MFPFIALLFTIPFILAQYHRYGSINKLRVLIVYSFIYSVVKCIKIMELGLLLILIIVFLAITLVFIFYIVSIIRALRNKNMPYDVVTRTNILSTIKCNDD